MKATISARTRDEFIPPSPGSSGADGLPVSPLSSDAENLRLERWFMDHNHHRAAHLEMALKGTDGLLEPEAASLAAAKASLTGLAERVGSAGNNFETLDRRCCRSSESAVGVLLEEYERLRALADVAEVAIAPQEIVVTTRDLIIKEGGTRYDIGPYRITIQRNGGEGSVKILALRPENHVTVDEHVWQHPHILRDGHPCWGNAGGPIGKALRDCELDVALNYILAVLKTGDVGEHGLSVYKQVLRKIGRPIQGP